MVKDRVHFLCPPLFTEREEQHCAADCETQNPGDSEEQIYAGACFRECERFTVDDPQHHIHIIGRQFVLVGSFRQENISFRCFLFRDAVVKAGMEVVPFDDTGFGSCQSAVR